MSLLNLIVNKTGFPSIVILSLPLRVKNKTHIALYSVEMAYVEPSGGHFNKCGVLMSSLWFWCFVCITKFYSFLRFPSHLLPSLFGGWELLIIHCSVVYRCFFVPRWLISSLYIRIKEIWSQCLVWWGEAGRRKIYLGINVLYQNLRREICIKWGEVF